MATQLNDIIVLVNNTQVPYTADSLSWKDGFGTYVTRNAVLGGGQTERIFSKNLESKKGMVKFSMPSIIANEAHKRAWKSNDDQNVVELVGPTGSGWSKVFTGAAILEDPETSAAADGDIEVEFESNPAT